ncbi:MAG: ISL3 family transposase [Allosphingosinicella sp.]
MPNQLYLPDWTVKNTTIDEDGAYRIPASYDVEPEACLKCGVVGQLYRHGAKTIAYRDAPVHGRQTVIEVRRGRYRCRECGGTFMQPLPDMDDERRMTIRCREYIERQALLKPNTHVSEDVGVDEKIVRQIFAANADALLAAHDEVMRAPVRMGIDELKLAGQMRAIFVDLETSWPFELLPNHWKAPVTNFLYGLRDRERTEIVTMDMWKPYKEAVQAAMPQATIIVDKWHVQRMANDSMERARRVYQKAVSAEERKLLKKGKSIFLRRPFQLSPKELLDLDGWLKNTPELKGAYEIKEAFMDIWKARTAANAKERLDAWRASIPQHLRRLFRPVLISTRNWEPEIMNYFSHGPGGRRTNAATEARNRVVKMTNRLGAGYNFENIRTRALFGKRPGRVRKERLAAEQARRDLELRTCWSCKAVYEGKLLEAPHIRPRKRSKTPVNTGITLCPQCERFHTADWFGAEHHSTPKSE